MGMNLAIQAAHSVEKKYLWFEVNADGSPADNYVMIEVECSKMNPFGKPGLGSKIWCQVRGVPPFDRFGPDSQFSGAAESGPEGILETCEALALGYAREHILMKED